jgi:hypothetical protein
MIPGSVAEYHYLSDLDNGRTVEAKRRTSEHVVHPILLVAINDFGLIMYQYRQEISTPTRDPSIQPELKETPTPIKSTTYVYLRDLKTYDLARDHISKAGTYDDYYGEVLDTLGRIIEALTTPDRSTSPLQTPRQMSRQSEFTPTSDVIPMIPPQQASQRNCTLLNSFGRPRSSRTIYASHALIIIWHATKPISIFFCSPSCPASTHTHQARYCCRNKHRFRSRLLRDFHAYRGPSVFSIGSTSTPVDTIGSLLLTRCHF